MKRIFTLLAFSFFLTHSSEVFSQTLYRSIASGNWNGTTVWEISTDNGGTWAPTTNTPTTNQSVTVNGTHEVSLNGSARNILNLTIASGGRVYAGGTSGLRIAAGSSGTFNNVGVLTNNGTLGGVGELMPLELHPTGSSLTLTGTGTAEFGRIRPSGANTNTSAIIIIDQNVKLNVQGNYAIAVYNGGTITENNTFTLNAGKTITFAAGTGYFHNGGNSQNTGGIYTYNINGILDMTATSGNTSLSPLASSASVITVNVSGTMKLGTGGFSMDTTSAGNPASWTGGVSRFNITGTGLLDATLANGTFKTGNALGQLIVISGSGALRRTAGASDVLFPIGTALTSYNPITINNSGTSDVFTASVSNTVSNSGSIIDATKIVNKQWTINEAVAGGTTATLKLGWVTADQAAGFSPAGSVVIGRWNGTTWQYVNATVTGAGTVADPYVASGSFTGVDFSSANPFIVANRGALPVSFAGSKAYTKEKGVQVEWAIATESNILHYSIERSVNGKDFASIGIVESKGNSSTYASYSFFDATPVAGANYYRIKAQDKDGSVKYTAIMLVNISKGKADMIVAPNPVRNNDLNVQLSGLAKGNYTLRVFNNAGQVVFTAQVATEGGSLSQSFKLPATTRAGVYTIQVAGNEMNINKKIVVE